MQRRVLFAAAGAVWFALASHAQQTPPAQTPATAQGDQQPPRFTGGVTVVSMNFLVLDRRGRFVTGFNKDDFQVLENKRPQTITEFSADPGLPLRVAVLIDTSNSIRERFRFEQQAASDFLGEVLRSTADKAMVVSFDSSPEIACTLTDNVSMLSNAIQNLRPGGGTSLYDALGFAAKALAQEQPSYKYKRIIVIVSDGEDNQSHYTRDQALEAVQVADASIYAISTNNLNQGDSDGDKVLRYFTGRTGGGSPYFPFKVEDLAQSFDVIAEEVRHQYNLVYHPSPLVNDGLFHSVEIRVKGHKELTIRARDGYFAR